MARIEDFEGCCTAKIIIDLGGSHTSEFGYHPTKYAKLWKDISGLVRRYQQRQGIICAIATSEQVTAQKVLKDLGFIGTGMAKKNGHAEVDIELYYLHCKDWVEPAKPADIVAPQAPIAAPQPFAAARNPAPQPARVQRPRDAQGRFVANGGAVRGNIVAPNGRLVTHVGFNYSYSTFPQGAPAKVVTYAEFEALLGRRDDRGYLNRITFQPI